jgi:hypothetical protein
MLGALKKIAYAKVGYFFDSGGEDGNRTRLNGFAGRIAELKIRYLGENLPQHLPSPKFWRNIANIQEFWECQDFGVAEVVSEF